MALSSSPRKVVPLSGGDGWEPHSMQLSASSGPSVTRRAFFCGVVVEGPQDGEDLSEGKHPYKFETYPVRAEDDALNMQFPEPF